jgi:N utilization substance protein B
MGKRSTGRKLAMQVLYQSDIRSSDPETVLAHFWDIHSFTEGTRNWASRLATDSWKNRFEIDEIIQGLAIGWNLNRIHPIDKAVLRLALFELKFEEIAPSIVINEALEICKKYSTDDSPKFINGILGQYVKQCLQES